jgi:hypothetical protein
MGEESFIISWFAPMGEKLYFYAESGIICTFLLCTVHTVKILDIARGESGVER